MNIDQKRRSGLDLIRVLDVIVFDLTLYRIDSRALIMSLSGNIKA